MEKIEISRAVLAGIAKDTSEAEKEERLLDELSRLLETAGGTAVARITQTREHPDPATYFGSGKIAELGAYCRAEDIRLVVFDSELSPSQIKNIENALGGDIEVIDRSMLILDIFALHAVSGEGKLQVELAQLKYTAPRLIGKGKEMSRLGGGIGTRGPGESKLETDRRHLKRRISALEAEIARLEQNRRTMRLSRDKSGITKAAIVGYTNAGKSTLLNLLTDAKILAEDKLFATLDPTTRKYTLPGGGGGILLTDTVGFIRKLPHHLIDAFKSTLDEAVSADMLIIVSDASDPEFAEQLEVTENLLAELGAAGKPTLYVFNKCDRGVAGTLPIKDPEKRAVYISAATGQGVDRLVEKLEEMSNGGRKRITYLIPHSEQSALNILYKTSTVENTQFLDDGTLVTATVDPKTQGLMRRYER